MSENLELINLHDDIKRLVPILEALLLTATEPLSLAKLAQAFPAESTPDKKILEKGLEALAQSCEHRAFIVHQVASGYRLQIKTEYTSFIEQVQQEKAPRYSRAFLETLAIIAYHQPVSRGEIEHIRGVSVNTHILKSLLEREWVKIVAYRDLPGKPAVYGTTPYFLDNFNLKSLEELPSLPQITDIEKLSQRLEALQGKMIPIRPLADE